MKTGIRGPKNEGGRFGTERIHNWNPAAVGKTTEHKGLERLPRWKPTTALKLKHSLDPMLTPYLSNELRKSLEASPGNK